MILTIGKKYRATFEDCCVSGAFESELIRAEHYGTVAEGEAHYFVDSGDVDTEGRLSSLYFANGVTMYDTFYGTRYTEVLDNLDAVKQ
jgi:hypothetical protein